MDRERGRLGVGLLFILISLSSAYPQFQNEIYRKRLPSFLTARSQPTRRSTTDYGPPAHVPVYINPYPEVPEELPQPRTGGPMPPGGSDTYQRIVLGDQNQSPPIKHHDEPQVTRGPVPPPTPSAPKSRLDEIARQVQKLLLDSKGHVDTNKIPEPLAKPGSKAPGFSPNRRNTHTQGTHRVIARDLPQIRRSGYDAEPPKTKTNGGITIHSSGYNYDGEDDSNNIEEGTSTVRSTYEDRGESKENPYKGNDRHSGDIDEGEDREITTTTRSPQTKRTRGYDQDVYTKRQKGYRQSTTTLRTTRTTTTPRPTTTVAYEEVTEKNTNDQSEEIPNEDHSKPDSYENTSNREKEEKKNRYDQEKTTRDDYEQTKIEEKPKKNGDDQDINDDGYKQIEPKQGGYEEVVATTETPRDNGYETIPSTNETPGGYGVEENKNKESGYEEEHQVNPYEALVEHTDTNQEGYHTLLARDAKAYVEEHKRLQRAMAKRIYAEIRKQIKRELDIDSKSASSSAKEASNESSESSEQLKEAHPETDQYSNQNNGYQSERPTNVNNHGSKAPKKASYLENIEEAEQPTKPHPKPSPDVKKLVDNFAKQSEHQAKQTRHQAAGNKRPQPASTTPKDFGFDGSVDRVTTPLPKARGYGGDEIVHVASPVPPVDLYREIQETTTHTPTTTAANQEYEEEVIHEAKPVPPVDLYGGEVATTTVAPETATTQGYDQGNEKNGYEQEKKEDNGYGQPKTDEGIDQGEEKPQKKGYDDQKEDNGYDQVPSTDDRIDQGEKKENDGYDQVPSTDDKIDQGEEKPENKGYDNQKEDNSYDQPKPKSDENIEQGEEKPEKKTKDNGYDQIPKTDDKIDQGEEKPEEKKGYGDDEEKKEDNGYDQSKTEKPEENKKEDNGYEHLKTDEGIDQGEEKPKKTGETNGGTPKHPDHYGQETGDEFPGDDQGDHKDEGDQEGYGGGGKDKEYLPSPPGTQPPAGVNGHEGGSHEGDEDRDHGHPNRDQGDQRQEIKYTEEGSDEQSPGGNTGGSYGGYSATKLRDSTDNRRTRGHRRELTVNQSITRGGHQHQRVFIDYEKGSRPQIYAKQDQDIREENNDSASKYPERRRASRYVPFHQVRHLFI